MCLKLQFLLVVKAWFVSRLGGWKDMEVRTSVGGRDGLEIQQEVGAKVIHGDTDKNQHC